MKIEWNKVTWYSKLAAVVLFLLVLTLGIYIGMLYQQIKFSEDEAARGGACLMLNGVRNSGNLQKP